MNVKRAWYAAWFAPLWIYLGVLAGRFIHATSQIGPRLAGGSWGVATSLVGLFALGAVLARYPLGRVTLAVLVLASSVVPVCLLVGAHGVVYWGLFLTTAYLDIGAVLVTREGLGKIARSRQAKREGRPASPGRRGGAVEGVKNVPGTVHIDTPPAPAPAAPASPLSGRRRRQRRRLATLLLLGVAGTCLVTGPLLVARVATPGPTRSFTITPARAASYDLVVYFPRVTAVNETVCEIFASANATLSFPLSEDKFQAGDPAGEAAAQAVQQLNAHGIPVEIWPLFERDEGHYPSIAEIDRWDDLYAHFHDWTVRHGLTVEYLLWDIETEGEGIDKTEFEAWPFPLDEIGKHAADARRIAEMEPTWTEALQTVRALGQQARADGHAMRTTTHTIIWDLFDGDADLQKQAGLPVWAAGDAFEYVSMMAYRGCEWGGTPANSAMIYDVVRASALTQPGTIAVCLGCINYTPYPTIAPVVADVHLALAAGADSIRLFQANSWIDGVGTWEGSGGMVYGGGAHGIEGFRALLAACREGGTTTYQPTSRDQLTAFGSVLLDVLWDLAGPF